MSFRSTRWSLVLRAGYGNDEVSRRAYGELFERYWKAIYSYIRASGKPPEDARDLTQEFLLMLLDRNFAAQSNPDRGRFRSYLMVSLKNFLTDQWRRTDARKRRPAGGPTWLTLDAAEHAWSGVSTMWQTPEFAFDKQWALAVLARARNALRARYVQAGNEYRFDALAPYLTHGEEVAYDELSNQLNISHGAAKVAVHRLRREFGRMVRQEIADTLADPEDLDQELRDLIQILRTNPDSS